jgi:hypothetical protein
VRKKKSRPISLSRETLRSLELRSVAGGYCSQQTACDSVNLCPTDSCPTPNTRCRICPP